MSIVVQKYGGSSVADVTKIQRVADKVVRTVQEGHQVVVVVSAMAKTTDSLLDLAQQAATVGAEQRPPARRELDMLVTTGERVSMALLSIAVQARGCEAISFTGSQCGIMTNDQHFNARIIEVRPFRVEDELVRGKVVIVAGYQGMSYRREITTLGRGGSDTTAVALAAALGADRCEIYSDVDGVYSADPRVVSGAKHLSEIDPVFLQNMAESGAKVLNAQAVEWARRKGIALYARASFGAVGDDGQPVRQTIVRQGGPQQDNRARAVTAQTGAVLLSVEGEDMETMGIALGSLDGLGLPVWSATMNSRGLSVVSVLSNVTDWEQIQQRLENSPEWRGGVVREHVAVVSVVGHNLGDSVAPTRKLVLSLAEKGVPVLQVGANPMRLHAVVPETDVARAQQALHDVFVLNRESL